jgi:hypothetical protein
MFDININNSIKCNYKENGQLCKSNRNDIEVTIMCNDHFKSPEFESFAKSFDLIINDYNVVIEVQYHDDYSSVYITGYYIIEILDVSKKDIDSIISIIHSHLNIHQEKFVESCEFNDQNEDYEVYEWK